MSSEVTARSLAIDPIVPAEFPEVFDLYRRTVQYPPDSLLEEYWNWKFCSHPLGGNRPQFWVARHEGRIVGGIGELPVVLDAQGRSTPASWAVDFMVDPRAQGLGIGKQIFDAYRRRNFVAMAMGPAPDSPTSHIARRVGFRYFPPVPYLFKLLTTRPLTVSLPLGRLISPVAAGLSRPVLRQRGRIRPISRPSLRVDEIQRFDPTFDALWTDVTADVPVSVRRDHQTMNWRYVDNPIHRHRVLAAWNGQKLAGCLVMKIVQHPVFSYGTMAELIASDRDVAVHEALLGRALDVFDAARLDIVKAFVSSPPLATWLRRAGFEPRGQGSDFMIALDPGLDARLAATLLDPSGWYLTKGDSDLDIVPDFMSRLPQPA